MRTSLSTVQCPSCGKTLVVGTPTCQFCGADTGQPHYGPGFAVVLERQPAYTWPEILYFAAASLWVVGGAYDLLQAVGWLPGVVLSLGGPVFYGAVASCRMALGLALLFQSDLSVTLARVFAVVQMIFSAVGVVMAVVWREGSALSFAYTAFQLGLAALVLYLLYVSTD